MAPSVSPNVSGLGPLTYRLLVSLEQVTDGHELARIQQALGVALWRAVQRNPAIAMTVDFDTERLELTDGGRRLHLTAGVFPPKRST